MSESKNWQEMLQEELGEKPTGPSRLLESAKSAFLHQHQGQLTAIQQASVPVIYVGKNVLLVSATASGKTEAVAIPIAAKLLASSREDVCLYIAPTRALLNDLHKRMTAPLYHLGIQHAIRHGDRPLTKKDEQLQVLFTTPESLDVLLCRDAPFLSKVRYAVVNEIHQVYGTHRGAQVQFLLERIRSKSGKPLQRIALSATVGDENELARWFQGRDSKVEIFSTGRQRDILPDIRWLDCPESLRESICSLNCKKVLVFANSRRQCDDVFVILRDLQPYRVFVHYSSLEKEQREYVERHFKLSEFAICVATSTLELGIDIGSIEAVILYDPPSSVGSFLQRIGRGGRRSGVTQAGMMPRRPLELLQFCAATDLASAGVLERSPSGHFYSVLVQQIFSMVAAKHHHRIHRDEIAELCEPWTWIQLEDQEEILTALDGRHYLRYEHGWHSYQMGPRLANLYNDAKIYSNIANGGAGVPVFYEGRRLTYLPIPLLQVRLGQTILFAGRYWEITSVSSDSIRVRLGQPVSNPIRPRWGGRGAFGLNNLLASRIKETLVKREPFLEFNIDLTARRQLLQIYDGVPHEAKAAHIFAELRGGEYVYYTFAGSIENRILQLTFQASGYECRLARRADGIALVSPQPLDFSALPTREEELRKLLESNWRSLADRIPAGPFFELLPTRVKKKQVLSQVAMEERLSHLLTFSGAKILPANLQLLD